jgi:hypothetical protein
MSVFGIGRAEEALPIARQVITIGGSADPPLGALYWVLGRVYFVMQNYDDAADWLQRSVDLRRICGSAAHF